MIDEARAWQTRPLEPCYPVLFFDAIGVNIRDQGVVANKAVYVALAILPDGTRDVLGLWLQANENEGAKFWAKVLNDLRNRGVQDILIAVVDGLKGFPAAIEMVFPQTQVQTCIVHLPRASMAFASFKDPKAIATALKAISYQRRYEMTDKVVGIKRRPCPGHFCKAKIGVRYQQHNEGYFIVLLV